MISRTFTIANLLWLVVGCAVVQGVILAPNAVTGTLFGLAILGILVTSLLAIGYRRGRRRAAWVGFAVFAWPFALLLFWTMLQGPRILPPDHVMFVIYWTVVPIFGFVGSIVARRLHDTRDPEAVEQPPAHPLDPDSKPQPRDSYGHAR